MNGGPQGTGGPSQDPASGRRYDPRQGLIIGRPFGIPVYVSPYLVLVAAVLVALYGGAQGSLPGSLHGPVARYGVAAAFVILLYASVLLHELSHSVVAKAFRLPVKKIVLYPLGGFSVIEPEPPTPGQEFLVSIAGPKPCPWPSRASATCSTGSCTPPGSCTPSSTWSCSRTCGWRSSTCCRGCR